MLRHACGFKLANDGHDTRAIQAYLGHRSIMSTVRYTALTPKCYLELADLEGEESNHHSQVLWTRGRAWSKVGQYSTKNAA
jgi:site-specific recombinase XerD